jgi:hypothetical protein
MTTFSRRTALLGLSGFWFDRANPFTAHKQSSLPHPDTKLLDACRAFRDQAAEMDRIIANPESDPGDQALWRVLNAMDGIEPTILKATAFTRQGLRAKARIVSWTRDGCLGDDPEGRLDERLLASILRDLLCRVRTVPLRSLSGDGRPGEPMPQPEGQGPRSVLGTGRQAQPGGAPRATFVLSPAWARLRPVGHLACIPTHQPVALGHPGSVHCVRSCSGKRTVQESRSAEQSRRCSVPFPWPWPLAVRRFRSSEQSVLTGIETSKYNLYSSREPLVLTSRDNIPGIGDIGGHSCETF